MVVKWIIVKLKPNATLNWTAWIMSMYKCSKCEKPDERKQYHKFRWNGTNHHPSIPFFQLILASFWLMLLIQWWVCLKYPINIYIFFSLLLRTHSLCIENRSPKFMVFGCTSKMNLTFHQIGERERIKKGCHYISNVCLLNCGANWPMEFY